MNKLHIALNLLIYYISWIGCIALAARGREWEGVLLILLLFLVQLYWQYNIRKETHGLFSFLIILTLTGAVVDTLLIWCGLISFAANSFAPYFTPPWMIAIWMSFSLTVFATLSHLFNQYKLIALLAFFGFAAAYAIGVNMGAAFFPYGYRSSLLIGCIWAFMLPICLSVHQWKMNKHD